MMAAPIPPVVSSGKRSDRVAAVVEDAAFAMIVFSAVALVAAVVLLALAL
jgi:hypothetical protein